MRILIVTPEYAPHTGGGIHKYYEALAPALARQGCDVTVLVAAPTSADFPDYEANGVRVVCVPQARSAARAEELAQFSAAPDFRRWLGGALAAGDAAGDLARADVIETVDFGLACAPFVLDRSGPPVVVQLHGSMGQLADHEPNWPERLLDQTLARLAEASLLPLADDLQTSGSSNAREWTARLHRPVTLLPPPMTPLPIGNGSLTSWSSDALVVGRVQSWKGPAALCEALRLVSADVPRVRWVGRDTNTAPGGGSLSAHLAAVYPDVWSSRVEPMGPRPFHEVQALMSAARFVIVPSDWDVFNFAAAEAMSAGRVVVCSDGAGASDLIVPRHNGLVFRAGDAGSLATALGEAAALTDIQRVAMGQAARETIASRLNPDAVAHVRLSLYSALASSSIRQTVAPADWVRRIFTGGGGLRAGAEFLDQMDVRALSRYLGKRVRTRLRNRMGGGAA